MKKSFFTIALLITMVTILTYGLGSCNKDNNPNNLTYLLQEIPAGFPQPVYRFQDNPLTKEGFELGRKLFYDGRLSQDNNHPCASCHQQIAVFGTYEHDRSHGVNSTHTLRNAPPLFNLAWQTKYHWDGEFTSLYNEAAQPIHGDHEMGETFNAIVNKIQKDPEYQEAFKKVFRTEFISPNDMLKALAQFTGSITSYRSKYDQVKKGTASFTTQEMNGYIVFQAKCATCHPEPMFTDYSFRNIGLPIDPLLNDYGRFMVTKNPKDSFKFKVPSLRSVYITSNYMHDGRFNTLAQCLNHYRTGVVKSSTVDPLITNGIALTNTEANDVTLFLRTLTDSTILNDPRFTKP